MQNQPGATAREPSPLPFGIEHVVYITKENRTYAQVFGDIKKGNGDPSLLMFGEDVTPNHHRLANQFVLLDNFYATDGNSGDGHQWLTQADETAYCLWSGCVGRSYPFDGTDPIAYAERGFTWDAVLKFHKTVRVYGEFAGRLVGSKIGSQTELLNRWKAGDDFLRNLSYRGADSGAEPDSGGAISGICNRHSRCNSRAYFPDGFENVGTPGQRTR
jgi:hypothetical protein